MDYNCYYIRAEFIPDDATEWLIEHDISIHYQNDVVVLCKDDGYKNPFTKWLYLKGFRYKNNYERITIIAT